MSAPNGTPRRWFITGANSGFGAAFTRAAVARGDQVVAAVRRPDTVAEATAAYPGQIEVVPLDVRDGAACRAAVAAAGEVDILVNNAGYGIVGAIEESTEDEIRDAMEVMFHGPLRLTRLLLPQLRARRSGTIVQVSSMGGQLSFPGAGIYSAAKGALELASEALAGEVAPLGIRVLIVEPGAYRTEFAGPALRLSQPIPDYAGTVDALRTGLPATHGRQPGDPDQAVAAVLAALELPAPPLRLALGDDATTAIRAKAERVLAELDATALLGRHAILAAGAVATASIRTRD
jgi:NAD(P)-dependent dehydrogenase (short-subunit alcohol dehydrogenase family)